MFVVMIVTLVAVAILQPIVAAWAIVRNLQQVGTIGPAQGSAIRQRWMSQEMMCRREVC
jgi:hypothetical protein